MNCREAQPLLHPYADGELDLVRHVEIERHLKDCPDCAVRETNLRSLRDALSAPALYHRAPASLVAKLELADHRPTPRRQNRIAPIVATAAVSSLAAALAILLMLVLRDRPSMEDRLAESVVACHIRSLQAEHLEDVVSTDQHTVKPWFRGKLDFSPQTADFAAQGYALSGGRLDYLANQAVAALVYRCRAHVINVFTWPAASEDAAVRAFSRQGYHLRCWQRAGMNYWAISDVNDHDLDEFVRLFQEQTQELHR